MFVTSFGNFGDSRPQYEFAARNRPRTTVFAVNTYNVV